MRRLDAVRSINVTLRKSAVHLRDAERISRNSRSLFVGRRCTGFNGDGLPLQRTRILASLSTPPLQAAWPPRESHRVRLSIISSRCRAFTNARRIWDEQRRPIAEAKAPAAQKEDADESPEVVERAFAKTEKASRAAQVNLSARLSKESSSSGNEAAFSEVWRLLRIARPEAKWLASMKNGQGAPARGKC